MHSTPHRGKSRRPAPPPAVTTTFLLWESHISLRAPIAVGFGEALDATVELAALDEILYHAVQDFIRTHATLKQLGLRVVTK